MTEIINIHRKERNMLCVAFRDCHDKDTVSQPVTGNHIKNDSPQDNGRQAKDNVFQWKIRVAGICAGTVKGNRQI